jgi:hypothetical protein
MLSAPDYEHRNSALTVKRRLDEQGINYTSKKAAENYCLVRLSADILSLCCEGERTSRQDCLPREKDANEKRTRMNSFQYGNKMYARIGYSSLPPLQRGRGAVGSR